MFKSPPQDIGEFYAQQEEVRQKASVDVDKREKRAQEIRERLEREQLIRDTERTIKNWKGCVERAAAAGVGVDQVRCDNGNVKPPREALERLSGAGFKVTFHSTYPKYQDARHVLRTSSAQEKRYDFSEGKPPKVNPDYHRDTDPLD